MKEFIFVKSSDDLRSIADSALYCFLEIEYDEVHDIFEDFEDGFVPKSIESNSTSKEKKKKKRLIRLIMR